MRIAFFGAYGCFGQEGIGGTESVVRRLAYAAALHGHHISFVRMMAPQESTTTGRYGIVTHDTATLSRASGVLDNHEHVVTIYLPPRSRLAYARYRRARRGAIVFHILHQNWPESRWKRALATADRRIHPYNGFSFCLSPRLHRHAVAMGERAILLWPPVPDQFFLTPEQKPNASRIRIAYMGRLDPTKGASLAIALFQRLSKHRELIETRIHGYAWPHDEIGMSLRSELESQDEIVFTNTVQQSYSPAVDQAVHKILQQTDVLFLPYRRLSSTIDTPLVMLEGMAHLCAVVTRPLGNIPQVYGHTNLMFDDLSQFDRMEKVILKLRCALSNEREHLSRQTTLLKYRTSQVVNLFLDSLRSGAKYHR